MSNDACLYSTSFACIYPKWQNVQKNLSVFFAFVSGANDRNKLSEVAISEMTPPPAPTSECQTIFFALFDANDDEDLLLDFGIIMFYI